MYCSKTGWLLVSCAALCDEEAVDDVKILPPHTHFQLFLAMFSVNLHKSLASFRILRTSIVKIM